MMKLELIDRYLYAVASHLPEDIREDVKRELKANIEDMLPDSPEEADIKEVLKKLGNPSKLANEYRPVKRYLIGPGLYDNYLSVLKLVIIIVASIMAAIAVVEGLVKPTSGSTFIGVSIKISIDMILAVIEGAMQAALWVTVTFVIIERAGVTEGEMTFGKKEWSPEDLPPLSALKKENISRGETVFEMICLVFFVSLIAFKPQLIGVYIKEQSGLTLSASFFVTERLRFYLLMIIVLAFAAFCILIYKLIIRRWTLPLAIVNAIHNISASVLVCILIADSSLINPDFMAKLAVLIKSSLEDVNGWVQNSLWVTAAIFVFISIRDSISSFVKLKE
jgi:hypothetical protein